MADCAHTTRRALLKSVPAYGLMAIVPAVAVAAEPDSDLIMLGKEFEIAFAVEEDARRVGLETDDWDAWDVAFAKTDAIVKKIEALPAQTLAELRVKARCVQWCYGDDSVLHEFDHSSTDLRFARQIVVNLLNM